jgi:hypothetical protein
MTGATVLPQMRDGQDNNPRVPTLTVMPKTKSKLPIQCGAPVAIKSASRGGMIRSTLASALAPPLGAVAADRQRKFFPIRRVVFGVYGHEMNRI